MPLPRIIFRILNTTASAWNVDDTPRAARALFDIDINLDEPHDSHQCRACGRTL